MYFGCFWWCLAAFFCEKVDAEGGVWDHIWIKLLQLRPENSDSNKGFEVPQRLAVHEQVQTANATDHRGQLQHQQSHWEIQSCANFSEGFLLTLVSVLGSVSWLRIWMEPWTISTINHPDATHAIHRNIQIKLRSLRSESRLGWKFLQIHRIDLPLNGLPRVSTCAGAIPWNWRCAHKGVNPQPKLLDLPWHLVPILYGETWLQPFFWQSLTICHLCHLCHLVDLWKLSRNPRFEDTSATAPMRRLLLNLVSKQLNWLCTVLSLARSNKVHSLNTFAFAGFKYRGSIRSGLQCKSNVRVWSRNLDGTTGWKHWSYLMKAWKSVKATTLRMRWLQANAPGFLATAQSLYQESIDEPGSRVEITKMLSPPCSCLFRLVFWKSLNHFHD